MDLKIDEGLKTLLDSGKDKGYLTYSQVNEYLPDDAVNPEKLDQLLLVLEEQGIELIDESEAEEREAGPGAAREEAAAELDISFIEEEDTRRIDDPVRMYLTQMGSIPLLKREEEIALAKKIEVTRKRFRRKVLECDGALRQVVDTLKRVHMGELPFDRTVKVSLTENLEKDKILQRMPHNLKTLEFLLEQNDRDFEQILDPRVNEEEKRKLRRTLRLRRRKAVTLVEELSIRTQKVQPLMKKLEQISARMNELVRDIEDIPKRADTGPLQVLNALARELLEDRPMHELFGFIVGRVMQHLKPSRAALGLLAPDGKSFIEVEVSRQDEADKSELRISQTVLAEVVQGKKALAFMDVASDARLNRAESIVMQGIHSILCAPVLINNQVVGVLYVDGLRCPRGGRGQHGQPAGPHPGRRRRRRLPDDRHGALDRRPPGAQPDRGRDEQPRLHHRAVPAGGLVQRHPGLGLPQGPRGPRHRARH